MDRRNGSQHWDLTQTSKDLISLKIFPWRKELLTSQIIRFIIKRILFSSGGKIKRFNNRDNARACTTRIIGSYPTNRIYS